MCFFFFLLFFLTAVPLLAFLLGLTKDVSAVVGAPWRCGVLMTQGGTAGIGMGHLGESMHDSTPQSGVEAPHLLKRSLPRLYYCCCCFGHGFRCAMCGTRSQDSRRPRHPTSPAIDNSQLVSHRGPIQTSPRDVKNKAKKMHLWKIDGFLSVCTSLDWPLRHNKNVYTCR